MKIIESMQHYDIILFKMIFYFLNEERNKIVEIIFKIIKRFQSLFIKFLSNLRKSHSNQYQNNIVMDCKFIISFYYL